MIYSIVPNEIIFRNVQNDKTYEYEEIEYKGCLLQASLQSNNAYKIHRIISTNPSDYLNEELQPGNIICLDNINNS